MVMNWRRVLIITGGVVVGALLVSAVVLPVALPGVLSIIGFTQIGVAAGSAAAAIQSSIGCVAAGSAFALAQSAAMTGAVPLVWTLIAGVAGGWLGGLVAWLSPIVVTRIGPPMRRAMTAARRVVQRAASAVGRAVNRVAGGVFAWFRARF